MTINLAANIQQFVNMLPSRRAQAALSGVASLLAVGTDSSGNIVSAIGTSVPTSGATGYAVGAQFTLKGVTTLGQCVQWVNVGTTTSCIFVPTGPVNGYGVNHVGLYDCTNGSTSSTFGQDLVRDTDIALAGHIISDDNDQIVSVIASSGKNYGTLVASADPLVAHDYAWLTLRNKCVPEYDIFAAGTHTTVGGAAAEAITVTGVLSTDIALAVYSATDDTDTISDVICTANTVTVTCSADPSSTHGFHYVVLRQRGSFKPSHYIAYAGTLTTTVGGAAAEAITVTGVAATDIPLVNYSKTDDTDSILKTVATADTITVTCSADPSTGHGFNYMALRAY